MERSVTQLTIIALPVCFGLMLAMNWLGEGLAFALLFVVFGWCLRGIWKADQLGKQVQCPECARPLWQYRLWVIASRRCGGCGKRILSEDAVRTADVKNSV